MFQVTVREDGADRVRGFFEELRPERLDLMALAGMVGGAMLEANAEARLAGVDRDGYKLFAISPITERLRSKAGKGDGPPLVPDGTASRAISDATIETTEHSFTHVSVLLWWPNCPWMQYHLDGAGPGHPVWGPGWLLPQRDIAGVNPLMRDAIAREVAIWLRDTVGKNGDWGMA